MIGKLKMNNKTAKVAQIMANGNFRYCFRTKNAKTSAKVRLFADFCIV
jgi:hypothetical protein